MADYFDLGGYHREVTTTSEQAQTWFDRGLVWMYGFNHEEAERCFARALEADPSCAMAHWGLAYCVGPNYNKGWDAFDPVDLQRSLATAVEHREAARQCVAGATEVEQALVASLDQRYGSGRPEDASSRWCEDLVVVMRGLHERFPDDLDVLAAYADAMLQCTPWQMWDLQSGQPTEGSHTVEAQAALEGALSDQPARRHPGVLHFYVHLMEMSPYPERALWAGEWLRGLVPDAGHLIHMTTHLDVLCGDYRRVIVSNTAAYEADQRFVDVEGTRNFYTLYRLHNLHFLIYGAMFLGQRATALEASRWLAEALPEDLLRVEVPPMADWLEGFLPMGLHVRIRFGLWQEIIDTPLPADPGLYCVTTAMTHYAKGVAYAATSQVDRAERQRELFHAAVDRVPESRTLFNNSCLDILEVASAMLDGEVEYRKGNYEDAFAHLRRSIALDDALPYDEPWGWMQPTRHAYGALLLEQGRVEEAAEVYREDLGFSGTLPRANLHPDNVWSLHGYHECLERLGRHEEAGIVALRLALQTAQADIPIVASCACRLERFTPQETDGQGRAGGCCGEQSACNCHH